MEPISSLHLLTEAVRNAGADIAPSYQEYIQLAFAIATDCGEAGRQDFLALCSLSSKYDPQAAEKLFSNALKTGHNDVHIGTAFHLAELCGVKIQAEIPSGIGTLGTQGSPSSSASHTRARKARRRSKHMRRRHGNGQRPDITSTHFRRTHPVALSPGAYPELRYLPHTIRYSSIGNGHCARGKYGAERPVCLWRKNDVALPANFCRGTIHIGQRYTITGTAVGRALS